MALLPRVDVEFSQERLGVNAVAAFAAANGLIWRENNVKDVGIDGQLEYVSPSGMATGRMVALQIKSGPSFFVNDEGESWRFYPEQKHRLYWERFPIPVIVVLHNPDTGESFWVDVRQAYRSGAQDQKVGISVPKAQTFTLTSRSKLFENAGVTDEPFTESLEEVLRLLMSTRSSEASFPLSYFQLFAGGLTNIVRSLYFGMDLVTNLVHMNLDRAEGEYGMGLGSEEYEFLFRYIQFLVSQDLANVDFGDVLIDWNDRQMVPHFTAPLSLRGRALVRLISEREDHLRSAGVLPAIDRVRVAQEHFLQMIVTEHDIARVLLTEEFERIILESSADTRGSVTDL
jgi:hypothetical protein